MKDPVSEALSCAPPTALQRLTPAQMPELISLTSHPTPQHRRLRPRQYPSDMADREGGLTKEFPRQPKLAVASGPQTCERRSEEHTSELQSLMRISYAVFCLKNKNKRNLSLRHQTTA